MKIIGITGTIGSGKGTIVDYLSKHKDFVHYSVREFLTEEIIKQRMPVNRDSMVIVANELRSRNTPSFIVEQLYNKAITIGKNCIIESIRTVGEVKALRAKGHFWLFAVDAKAEIRFERIKVRNSETDQIDFTTFLSNEKREMTSDDPTRQNLFRCIEMADFIITNNGNKEDLYKEVEKVLSGIEK